MIGPSRLAAGAAALLLLATAACGGSRPAAQARGLPSASATAQTTGPTGLTGPFGWSGASGPTGPSYASPARVNPPAASGARTNLPANPTVLSCRLPLAKPDGAGNVAGGFLSFPWDTFAADPSSSVQRSWPPGTPSPLPYQQASGAPPSRSGTEGLSYSAAAHRWLPVRLQLASPHGTWWAYADEVAGGVVLAGVASAGLDVVGAGQRWYVLAVGDDGAVYARTLEWPSLQSDPGLWKLSKGAPAQQLATTGDWSTIGGGAAWGAVTMFDGTNELVRLDLSTKATVNWMPEPKYGWWPFVVDTTGTVVEDDEASSDREAAVVIRIADRPGHELRLTPPVSTFYGGGYMAVDPVHGVFMTTATEGLWLLTPQRALVKVSDSSEHQNGFAAGPCF